MINTQLGRVGGGGGGKQRGWRGIRRGVGVEWEKEKEEEGNEEEAEEVTTYKCKIEGWIFKVKLKLSVWRPCPTLNSWSTS